MSDALILYSTGSPAAPEKACIRDYLERFLSDRLVVRINRFIWQPVLHTFILRSRPERLIPCYEKIFKDGQNPYLAAIESLRRKLAEDPDLKNVRVLSSYAYCEPFLDATVKSCLDQGCENITVLPLFPQYSDTTGKRPYLTLRALHMRHPDARFRLIAGYADNPVYIKAVADSLRKFPRLAEHRLLLSYHSLPVSYIRLGDPYLKECRKTTQALCRELNMTEDDVSVAFQSRMGPMSWLKPYIEEKLQELASQGRHDVIAATPGFSIDCIETLYELQYSMSRQFSAMGGDSFTFVPCLNDSEDQVRLVKDLFEKASDLRELTLPSLKKA